MSGVIHVGAWTGMEYAGHQGPLVLFEPQVEPFKQLVANLGKQPGTVLVNVALGAEAGNAEMNTSSPDYSSSLLAPKKHLEMFPNISFNGTETVLVSTLDKEMGALRDMGAADNYTTLVIDVQGYELEVLKGATETLKHIERITCEVNTDETYEGCARLEQVDAFLAKHGFKRMVLDLWADTHGDALYVR